MGNGFPADWPDFEQQVFFLLYVIGSNIYFFNFKSSFIYYVMILPTSNLGALLNRNTLK